MSDATDALILSNDEDERAIGIALHCGLTPIREIHGYDATDSHENFFEIKTTRREAFDMRSSGITRELIGYWQDCYWLAAQGHKDKSCFIVANLWLIHPAYMEEYFENILSRLDVLDMIAEEVTEKVKTPYLQKELPGFVSRGNALSQQHLSLKYVRRGLSINLCNSDIAEEQVRQYVHDNPILGSFDPKTNNLANQFFSFNEEINRTETNTSGILPVQEDSSDVGTEDG